MEGGVARAPGAPLAHRGPGRATKVGMRAWFTTGRAPRRILDDSMVVIRGRLVHGRKRGVEEPRGKRCRKSIQYFAENISQKKKKMKGDGMAARRYGKKEQHLSLPATDGLPGINSGLSYWTSMLVWQQVAFFTARALRTRPHLQGPSDVMCSCQ